MSNEVNVPEGVERFSLITNRERHREEMQADPHGRYLDISDLPKIIEQARSQERQRLEGKHENERLALEADCEEQQQYQAQKAQAERDEAAQQERQRVLKAVDQALHGIPGFAPGSGRFGQFAKRLLDALEDPQ